LGLEEIHQHWPDILNELKQRSVQTWGLMNTCRLLEVEGSAVVFGWQSNMLKDKFESGKDRRLVEEVMSEVLGQKVLIRSQVDDPVLREALRLGAKVTPVSHR
jgi:hypothetical protein